jgi:DNA-binding IclR family transcriptional regulator
MSDSEIFAYATRTGLPAFTPRTIVRTDQLLQDAHRTQAQGWTLSDQDVSPGIAAVGAPVRGHNGNVVASISVSGISTIYTSERIAELAEAVKSAAWRLSRQMGYPADE